MKTILVPIEQVENAQALLETALIVARQFGSYIEGVHISHPLSEMIQRGRGEGKLTPSMIEELRNEELESAKNVREVFGAFMEERNVRWSDGTIVTGQPTAGWAEQEAAGVKAVGERARIFDMTVVENYTHTLPTMPFESDRLIDVYPESHLLQSILFESGRPILVSPSTPPETLGKTILIAWNCSLEAARTTAFALPLLKTADKVVLITVEEGTVPGPSGAEALHHLRRNGIEASNMEVERGKRSVGEAILRTATKVGADLLIKSAYTHSRLSQFIFGGGTSHILKEATLPVLMAH